MQSWQSPDVPDLTRTLGHAPSVVVYDTAGEGFVATHPGDSARLYVCGITPYDATHLGHAATYLAFDLLVRAWRDAGHDVTYVQNVTDVDDPLLARAEETGDDWQELAARETELFRGDMADLRMIAPDHYIGATESIPQIVELVQRLREAGAVYELDGDLYFSVACDPRFGAVSGLSRDEMSSLFGERGGDPDRPGKKDPLDALLWKAQRGDDPAWRSDLGPGRPGWHIECTAIALEHLGMAFDVQGGGSDLAFPHHEMSASHGQVATDTSPFAQAYVHAGMVGWDGEKMSKSKGNLVLVSKLRAAGADPMALRLALLGHHYRDDWEWTEQDLRDGQQRLDRWRAAARLDSGPDAGNLVADVRSALARDLDAPRALVAVDAWADAALAGQSGTTADPAAPGQVARLVDARLGIEL